jgi:glycosyltransferase involved in cell wall biosynthesis
METTPLISIIIPTYNRSQWLRRSVKQAFIHDYPNYEVIVSNNASTDNTSEVLFNLQQEYPKLKVVNHESLLPLNIHWDTVIKKYSKGSYLMVIPDDDIIIESTYLSKAINLFNTYESLGLVFGNYRTINNEGNELSEIRANFDTFTRKDFMYENYNKTLFGIKGIGIPHLTAIFCKEAYLNVGGFDILSLCPDTYLWLKILLFKDVGFVNECVAEYMIHPDNLSKTANLKQFYSDTKIVNSIIPLAKESNIPKIIIKNTLRRMESKFLKAYLASVIRNVKLSPFKTIFQINYITILKYLKQKNYYKCEK